MKVVVTGGTGLLGSAVLRALLARDHDVVAVVRPTSDLRDLSALARVRTVVVAPTDDAAWTAALRGAEGLCHVAGAAGRFYARRDEYGRTNTELTARVFAAARRAGVRRAVYTGTVAAAFGLDNPYARSKQAGARCAREQAGPDMDVIVVHPSGMIGPRDRKPTPLGRSIALFADGGQRIVVGGGSGYIHVDDAALAHAVALERGDAKREYVLDAEYWPTADLFARLAEIVGRPPPRVLPVGLAHALARIVEPTWRRFGALPPITSFTTSYLGLPAERFVGGEASRRALGLEAYRTIESALAEAVAWFREHGYDRARLAGR